jgi:hypothetical protein
MRIKYQLAAIMFISFLATSCKKVIDLQLGDSAQQLIIEGNITDVNATQTVTISKSVPFNNPNSFPTVSGATVKVVDGNGNTRNFTESTPGNYTSATTFAGRYGQKYTLQVLLNGQTYTATSTMPIQRVNLDSISVNEQTIGNSSTKTLAVQFQDPPDQVNKYRFVMAINGVQVKDVFVRDDQFSNGRHVEALLYQDDIKLKTGDKAIIEMQCIDQMTYTYWYTFSQQTNNFDSATPSNPPNNFNGNVLGYFSAHTSQFKSVVIP